MSTPFSFTFTGPVTVGDISGTFQGAFAGTFSPASPPPPVEPIDPATLTGRHLDLLAAPANCFTDNGVTQAGVGGAVQRWNDISGQGRHYSQATAANKPLLQQPDGLYAVQFDGSNDWMTESGFLSLTNSTLYAVWRMDDARENWNLRALCGHKATNDSYAFTFFEGNGPGSTYYKPTSTGVIMADAAVPGAMNVQAIRRSGSAVSLYTGQTPGGTGTTDGAADAMVISQIGSVWSAVVPLFSWNGYVRRLIAFNEVHDEATILGVNAWLAAN